MEKIMKEIEYKFILLGDSTVGKSSIFSRFRSNSFNDNTIATVGIEKMIVNFDDIEIDKNENIYKNFKITLFDTAGQERYKAITKSYFRDSKGIILIYSINNITTFEHVQIWLESIKESLSDWKRSGCAVMLLGNKLDIIENNINERQVLIEEAEQLCKDQGIYWGGECSAKTFDLNQFKEIFEKFIKEIYLKLNDDEEDDKQQISKLVVKRGKSKIGCWERYKLWVEKKFS